MQEAVTNTQHLSIMLCYFANGNNLEDLKFVRVTSQSTGITVLETCLLLDRQTVTETTLLNTVHRIFTKLCNPAILQLYINYIVQ
jgi:hypothetical protein